MEHEITSGGAVIEKKSMWSVSLVKYENYIATTDDLPGKYMLAILVLFHDTSVRHRTDDRSVNLYVVVIRENFRFKNAY